jgi:hypothetical protein
LDDDRVSELEKQQNHERVLADLRKRQSAAMREVFSTNLEEASKRSGN